MASAEHADLVQRRTDRVEQPQAIVPAIQRRFRFASQRRQAAFRPLQRHLAQPALALTQRAQQIRGPFCLRLDTLEQQLQGAAAALPQAGAEGEALQPRRGIADLRLEHRAGDSDGAVFELATAEGIEAAGIGHQQMGAGFARRRTAGGRDCHQHRGAFLPLRFAEGLEPAHQDWLRQASTARNTASGVAGASSGGCTRPLPMLAMASRRAKKTENPSSSGGSPTALDRITVGL